MQSRFLKFEDQARVIRKNNQKDTISSHTELKCQIWVGNCCRGYTCQIWHFYICMDSLDFNGLKKVIKGRWKSKSPNQRPESKNMKISQLFNIIGFIGIIYSQIPLFLSFKVIKAKKAALVAENSKLHSKLLLFL